MGLFSNLRKSPALDTDTMTAKAMIVPSMLVMAADGRIDETERLELVNAMQFNGLFQRIGPKAVPDMISDHLKSIGARGGVDEMVASMEMLSPALRETAICMAIRMAAADGNLDDQEHEVLVTLAIRLGVSPEQFNKMAEVVAILQRAA